MISFHNAQRENFQRCNSCLQRHIGYVSFVCSELPTASLKYLEKLNAQAHSLTAIIAMSYPPNQYQGYYPPQGGYYDPNQPQYATQGHPTTAAHGHGPPPPVPGNRPPIPGNRPAAPTPFNHGQAPAIPAPHHSAPAPAPTIPVPHHGSGSHSTAMPTAAPNAHSANPHQTAASSHPGGTILYNGLIVPDLRAPPAAHGVPKVPGYNPLPDAEAIHKACKGFGTDEAACKFQELITWTNRAMDVLNG
ncbi:hypothetical protein H0H93_015512 [Arthromyces matolae]|nr:hypothetical protein H0H93_015512 [Arthromyces matolae]